MIPTEQSQSDTREAVSDIYDNLVATKGEKFVVLVRAAYGVLALSAITGGALDAEVATPSSKRQVAGAIAVIGHDIVWRVAHAFGMVDADVTEAMEWADTILSRCNRG